MNSFVIRICSTLLLWVRTLCHYEDSAGKQSVLIDMPSALKHIDNASEVLQGRLLEKVTEATGSAILHTKALIIGLIEGLHCEVVKEQRRNVTSLKKQCYG